MAKKKTTIKKKATPKKIVNKKQEIKKALAATPDKPPKQISEELKAKGIDVSPGYVSTTKTNLKAEAGAPKTATTEKAARKQEASKTGVTAKQQAPTAAPATSITYDQLLLAKDLAQQLGGIEKAKETLAALSALASD